MKKLFTLIAASLIVVMLFAQSPEKMNFQAVVRDNNNNLITNTVVGIRITILQNSTPVYFETQRPVTNSNGLITIAFGGEAGFNKIDWANGPYFIKSEIDPKGGSNYTITGTSQLMSVPYAFHAQTASYLIGEDNQILKSTDKGVPSQNWSLFGNSKSNPLKDKLGTTDKTDLVFVTDNIERLRITSNGDINLKKSFEIGEDLIVKRNAYLNTESGETFNKGPFTVLSSSPTKLTGSLSVDGSTHLNNKFTVEDITDLNSALNVNNQSSTYLSGDLKVDGLATINDVSLKSANITGNLTVAGITQLNNSLYANRNTYIGEKLFVSGDVEMRSLVNYKDYTGLHGHLYVNGTTELKSSLTANGPVTINNSLTSKGINSNGQVIIKTEGVGSATDFPLIVEGNNNGISIKVNAYTPSSNNKYITFWTKGNHVAGRIEGQTEAEKYATDDYKKQRDFLIWNQANRLASTLCTFWDLCSLPIVASDYALAQAEMIHFLQNIRWGVTYESGSADYAEWLEKENQEERFYPGDIVGVKAGKISLNTQNADHFMVISRNPIVLGNMPETGRESEYEKVAFLGQVHVKVVGEVNKGDYIIPSGRDDGFGIAISPDKIGIVDIKKIVGIAWAGSSNALLSFVNVAVGLNTNDMARHVMNLENKIEEQAKEIEGLYARLSQIDDVLAKLDGNYVPLNQNLKRTSAQVNNQNTNEIQTHVAYNKITLEQIEEGITMAEAKMREAGVDVDTHPFFVKLKTDPDYKMSYITNLKKAVNDEVERMSNTEN